MGCAFAPTDRQRAYEDNFRLDSLYYDGAGNQLFGTTVAAVPTAAELRDAAYFYGADGKLAASDMRNIADHTTEMSMYTRSFEEYRYDALGRRILVRLRRDCAQTERTALCEMGFVRRTVWDGDQELYEIQAWGGWRGFEGTWMEADTARPREAVSSGQPMDTQVDPNPFLGRVAYTHGLALDQPLGVVRMGYTSRLTSQNSTSTTRDFEPVAIVPFWNRRGQPALGAFADGTWRKCMSDDHCVNLGWPEMWAGYARPKWERSWWHGTLLEDKADASGLNYRRNRYYDPISGRFTQEDPIGIAGGLNVYGFAGGDPVNFWDPFGLCSTYIKPDGQSEAGPTDCKLKPITVRARRRAPRTLWVVGPRLNNLNNLDQTVDYYRAFYARAQEVRVRGHNTFPGEENSYSRHRCGSYILADEWGAWNTRIFGAGNEVQGLVRWDLGRLPSRLNGDTPWAFQWSDLRSNEDGIGAARGGHLVASATNCVEVITV